jgi:hypothetical protein
MATLERQSNNFLVEERLEEPWIREWTQGITCKLNSTNLNSASQSSTFNSSLKSPLLTDFSWQRTEPSDKLVTKQDVTYQSTPQLGSDGVEALVASCPLKTDKKIPNMEGIYIMLAFRETIVFCNFEFPSSTRRISTCSC